MMFLGTTHNEELHNLPSSPRLSTIIRSRRTEAAGHKKEACRILAKKAEGKRPLGRPRRRWIDSMKIDLGEIGWGIY
jgi:hypothetical protein